MTLFRQELLQSGKDSRTPMPARPRNGKRRNRPRLPEGVRIYAIGDIHGRSDLLRQMFTVIDADLARSPFNRVIHVFLGDYIDRGPDSHGTIELLLERARRHESVFLKGNHESLLLQVLEDPALYQDWKKFGGLETLISYGVRPAVNLTGSECSALINEFSNALPVRHHDFFRALRTSYSCGDFFFVHAGVKPGIPLDRQRAEDLLWIRDEFLLSEKNFGKYVVHGHSPVRSPDIRNNRINIDTGAYATGNLTLLSIQGASLLAI